MTTKANSRIREMLYLSLSCLVMFFIITAATAQQKVFQLQDNPLDLPLQTRLAELEKGNLLPNPSFEKGSGNGTDLKISNWQIVGNSVEWVDKSSFSYSVTEVYDGSRSIRIRRSGVDETAVSEGLKSDFIQVIPGNYTFSLYLRLAQISSATERLGDRLGETVDLRLEYYDENKKLIDPLVLYPYKNVKIDQSFKGYSFSNFSYIGQFGWGWVIGRTYNYPFSEGDLPAGTRFVKVFIGLRGNGTMWVDKADFRYSAWNLTPLEKISAFEQKEFSLREMLIPCPQEISRPRDIRYYDKSSPARVPVIIIPSKASVQTLAGARLLKEKLDLSMRTILGKAWKKDLVVLTSTLTDSLSKTASVIFSVGNNELCLRYADSIPQKVSAISTQAYFIKGVGSQMIFLRGNGPVGDYYAATTLVQLIDPKDFLIRCADIVDYPDFEGRSLLLAAWKTNEEVAADLESMKQMTTWKLNKAYVGYGQANKSWHTPTEVYRKGVEEAAGWCSGSGLMDLAQMVNPYYHFDYEMPVDSIPAGLKYTWTHGDPHSLDMLKNVYRTALDSGAGCIMLLADDFVPHEGSNAKNYSLYTAEDQKRFVNLQNAQAYVINELYKWLQQEYPGTRFEFCPPWYLNEFIDKSRGKAEAYFSDLRAMIPEDVAIVWTGNTVRSLSIDQADIFRYSSLCGRSPMLWDNTLYARSLSGNYGGWPAHYPSKVRLCNIFEPYDVLLPADFSTFNDSRHMYVNGDAFTDPYKVKYMTVADFEWNTEDYRADFSMWKALVKTYGKPSASKLMLFNDRYYALMQLSLYADAGYGNEKDVRKEGDELAKELNTLYAEISKSLESRKMLLAELRALKDEQIRVFKLACDKLKKSKSK